MRKVKQFALHTMRTMCDEQLPTITATFPTIKLNCIKHLPLNFNRPTFSFSPRIPVARALMCNVHCTMENAIQFDVWPTLYLHSVQRVSIYLSYCMPKTFTDLLKYRCSNTLTSSAASSPFSCINLMFMYVRSPSFQLAALDEFTFSSGTFCRPNFRSFFSFIHTQPSASGVRLVCGQTLCAVVYDWQRFLTKLENFNAEQNVSPQNQQNPK